MSGGDAMTIDVRRALRRRQVEGDIAWKRACRDRACEALDMERAVQMTAEIDALLDELEDLKEIPEQRQP